MKRKITLLALLVFAAFVCGCIISSSPGKETTINPGKTQEFKVTAFPADEYEWFLDDKLLSGETAGTYVYSPELKDQVEAVDEHTIEVKVFSDGSLIDSHIWYVDVSLGKLESIDVTPACPWILLGQTQQFKAKGEYEYGTLDHVTAEIEWSSDDESVATVSDDDGSSALATAVSAGMATISAIADGITGSTVLTVTESELISIGVTPANPSIPQGETQQFTATGLLDDLTTLDNITNQVVWNSSDESVATVSNAGLATAVSVGTATISAAAYGITGFTDLTVTPAELISIEITPANPSIPYSLTQQFKAKGLYTNGYRYITTEVEWSSSDESVATISNETGTKGLATSVSVGTTTISATLGEKTGSTELTVTEATLKSIEVTPVNPSIPLDSSQQFKAEGTYTDSSTYDITTSVTWSSSDESVATISNESGSEGLATSVSDGTTTISAALGGRTGSTVLTVTEAELISIEITPANPSIPFSLTQQFEAEGVYTDGTRNITTQAVWSSGDESVATISNESGSEGLATSAKVGTTTISATLGGITGSTVLTVTEAELMSIEVTPANPSIQKGNTQQFEAKGLKTDGTKLNLTNQVTWESSNESVATVSNAGLANGISEGIAIITADKDNIVGFTVLTVVNP